jgi:hypothetical protein
MFSVKLLSKDQAMASEGSEWKIFWWEPREFASIKEGRKN